MEVTADAGQVDHGRDPRRPQVGRGHRRPSAAGSPASRRPRPRAPPSRRRPAPPDRHAGRSPRRRRCRRRRGRRAPCRGSSGSGGPAPGSRYANAALTLTPSSTLTGSIPKPTPPSRSSRSSARGQAEGRRRVEAGAVERADLVLGVGAHGQPLERARERRPNRVGAPAGVAGRRGPAVVVGRAADGDDAPVVGGAAADHPGARERDRLASGDLSAARSPSRAR